MKTEMGEYFVGACLEHLDEYRCDYVLYNVRPSGGGLKGLREIDVVGIKLVTKTVYLSEVTTHLASLGYGMGYKDTIDRFRKK